MGELTKAEKSKLADCEATIDAFRRSYYEAGRALLMIREEQLYLTQADTFEDYCRRRWQFTDRHARRLIAAYEAADDVKEVPVETGPMGPPNERIAREISLVETEQGRADLWTKVVESAPRDKETDAPKVTASHVAKVRKELFGGNAKPKKGKAEPTAIQHLKGLIATIDTVRVRIDSLKADWKPESQSWQTALDYLDEARKAFVRLTK